MIEVASVLWPKTPTPTSPNIPPVAADKHIIPLLRILTDRGTEYCGTVESHAYQMFLGIEDIEHTKTKASSPQTNGICERFHKTMKDECYNVLFRKKIYKSLDELQQDVDEWLNHYIRPLHNALNLR
jgi:hypothetical protein